MQMVDVIKKLKEIADRSPEIANALDNAQRMSMPEQIEEGVKITVSGSDAVLHQILKLAGMIGAETEDVVDTLGPMDSMDQVGSPDPMAGVMQAMPHHQTAIAVGEEDDNRPWETSPHEVTTDPSTAVPSGSDMHRAKGTYPKVAGADNPMASGKLFGE